MRIIRSGEYRCMPWKNGGGETAEIDIFPPESGIDAFDWRVSMAHVTADGAFSQFTGIDRTLSILEGKGIRLAVSDQAGIDITPDSLPYSFPADVPTVAQLIDGPVIDLNVMTRRGRFVHRVTRLRQTAPVVWRLKSDLILILARGVPLQIDSGSNAMWLAAGDAAVVHGVGTSMGLTPTGRAEICIVEFDISVSGATPIQAENRNFLEGERLPIS